MKLRYGTLAFVILLLCFPLKVHAAEVKGYATSSDVLIASSPNKEKPDNSCNFKDSNGKYSNIYADPEKLRCLDAGDTISILNYNEIVSSTISSCKQGFYYVSYTWPNGSTYKGYVCADYVKTQIDTKKYEEEFKKSGIPESYYEKLTILKDNHPNWKFTGYNTGLDWNTVIQNESIVGMSYIQNSNPIYLSLEEGSYNVGTNTYNMMEKGGWYAANKETVAYYMDPRNFFDDKRIFMFENLGYNPNYQTETVVKSIVKNTKLTEYVPYFIEAATFDGNSISPIMLAARSRQEVVLSDGTLSNSANGTKKYYNFYNIGAFSSCENPVDCAIDFAGGYEGKYTSFNRPWITAELAIKNGAKYIANGYINGGQNTLYFQKWNVTNNSYGNYSHQYMTNIMAPSSEAKSTYNAYSSIDGLLGSSIEFIIPVYDNIPTTVSNLPIAVDTEKIEDKKEEQNIINIGEIISKSGYSIHGDFLVNIQLNETAFNLISKIKATSTDINISVIRNGKPISGEQILGTNDIVTIKDSVNTYSFRVIIYGDTNGDGKVSAVDYVKIKNYIMGSSGLDGSFKEAADVNRDGRITAVDYVNVKNFIMGSSSVLK